VHWQVGAGMRVCGHKSNTETRLLKRLICEQKQERLTGRQSRGLRIEQDNKSGISNNVCIN